MPSIPPITRLSKKEVDWLYLHKCKRHSCRFITHYSCYLSETKTPERVGYFDIETTGFKADWDIMLSYAILDGDTNKIYGRVLTPQEIQNKDEDKQLVKDLCQDLRKFDRIVGYYSDRFDFPFSRTRAEIYKLDFPVFGELVRTDLYWVAKGRFCMSRKSLENMCRNFGIESKGHRMYPEQWKGARRGVQKDLNFVWTHNKEDVYSTRELARRVMKYSRKTNTSI